MYSCVVSIPTIGDIDVDTHDFGRSAGSKTTNQARYFMAQNQQADALFAACLNGTTYGEVVETDSKTGTTATLTFRMKNAYIVSCSTSRGAIFSFTLQFTQLLFKNSAARSAVQAQTTKADRESLDVSEESMA
jgi:hypothetical protein